MNKPSSITREAALRIVQAAAEIGGLPTTALTKAIVGKLGLPLTETMLASLSVEDLRAMLAGDHADSNCSIGIEHHRLQRAQRLLCGIGVSGSELPPLEAYRDGDLPGSIRVACASNSGENLDGHFGTCQRFLIYQISPDAIRLIDARSTLAAEAAEEKNAARTALIADCHVLQVQSIGGPAVAKVVRAGIHPVKVPNAGPARDTLTKLQTALRHPPPWLARIMGVTPPSLSAYAEELALAECEV